MDKGAKIDLPKESEPIIDPVKILWTKTMEINDPIPLHMSGSIISKTDDIILYIYEKDLHELIKGNEMLCVSVLQVWLM